MTKNEEAIRVERARAKAERQKGIEDEKRREADVKHRDKINDEALEGIKKALFGYGLFHDGIEDNAAIAECEHKLKVFITAIANGKVPHISIKY